MDIIQKYMNSGSNHVYMNMYMHIYMSVYFVYFTLIPATIGSSDFMKISLRYLP